MLSHSFVDYISWKLEEATLLIYFVSIRLLLNFIWLTLPSCLIFLIFVITDQNENVVKYWIIKKQNKRMILFQETLYQKWELAHQFILCSVLTTTFSTNTIENTFIFCRCTPDVRMDNVYSQINLINVR